MLSNETSLPYRPFHVGVASRLATAIYVAMVTPILYGNSYNLNDSNLKYESYRPYGVALHHRTQYLNAKV